MLTVEDIDIEHINHNDAIALANGHGFNVIIEVGVFLCIRFPAVIIQAGHTIIGAKTSQPGRPRNGLRRWFYGEGCFGGLRGCLSDGGLLCEENG